MLKKYIAGMMLLCLVSITGCQTEHKIVHEANTVHKIEVAPMHITIDINVKVDQALDDFFGDLDE